jgi:osmotically-inducible protein OsmY
MKKDKEIQKNVMDELNWVPLLNATEIGVSVINGIVTLAGTVDSYAKKIEAEKAAKSVYGVRAVVENIAVVLPSSAQKTDTEIAQAVLDTLSWHSNIPEDKITVTVEGGLVRLDGEVEWDFQRTVARNAISHLVGVKGVLCNISIQPRMAADQIGEKVLAAFKRNANIDADKIHIEVIGNTVVLTGTVFSFDDRTHAEDAAWTAPGVKWVENKITVDEAIFAF